VQEASDRFHCQAEARAQTLRVGDPLDKSTDIGAVVAQVQLDRIRRLSRPAGRGRDCCGPPADP